MIKMFISDLDGTLIYKAKNGLEPNERNKRQIEKLKEKKVEFAIATGRYDEHIQIVENFIGQKNYRIGMNGGTIYDTEGNLIRESTFTYEEAGKIKKYIEKNYMNKINFLVLSTNKTRRFIKYPGILKRIGHYYRYEKPFKANLYRENLFSYLESEDEKIIKILINTGKNTKYSIEEELKDYYKTYEIAISGPYSMEICPIGNKKGIAIEEVMKLKNLKRDEVAFIGDSYNDLSGFQACEHSFAMSHADLEIRKNAKYTVEDVAEAIDKVLEINNNVFQEK